MPRLRDDLRAATDPGAPPGVSTVQIAHDGTIRAATASAAAMLGCPPEDLVGRSLAELAALGAREPVLAAVSRFAFGTGEMFDLQLEGRNGRRTLIRVVVRRLVELGSGKTEFVTEWIDRRDDDACEGGADPKRLAYALLSRQEAERSRVSSGLHSEVAPVIHLAKLTLGRAVQQFVHGSSTEALMGIDDAALRLREVLNELVRISSELRPSVLDDLGLLPTIDWYCRQFEAAHRKPRVEHTIDVREQQVPDHLKLDIFRILQEALSNTARHAEANRAQITLTITGCELLATVKDDGIGFDVSETFNGNGSLAHIGLFSMKKRICATGGRMLLDSSAGRGTLVGAAWNVE